MNDKWKEIEVMLKLTPVEETVAGQELIQRGSLYNAREFVIEAIETRFGNAPELVVAVIERIDDPAVLKTLHRQAITADSLEAFERVLAGYAKVPLDER